MPTDTTEKGLETLIVRHMTGGDGFHADGGSDLQETPDEIAAGKAAGSGWISSSPNDHDRGHCIDITQFFDFLHDTQAEKLKKTGIGNYRDAKDIARQKFLARISSEIGKRGVIDVLRRGSRRTASASPGSSATVRMKHGAYSTSRLSSMACRSLPSS